MHSPSLLLTAALEYAERGWRVIPLHTPTGCAEQPCSCLDPTCDSPGKHPRIREWQRQGTTDEAPIRRWWQMWPSSNIGIVCGAGTGWFALDVDGEEGEETLRLLEAANSELPAAPEQITGSGGRHLLFAYEPGLTNAVKFAPGLDIRTDGGQIVVEPSLHPNGQEYRWELAHHPAEMQPPRAPGWLLTAIRKAAAKAGGAAAPIGEQIPEGQRNNTLASVAGGMRRRGADPEEIEAALAVMNRNRCRPPLAATDVHRIATSVGRYAPETARNGAGAPGSASSVVEDDEVPREGEPWEEIVDLVVGELPAFPVDALPVWMAAQVLSVAKETQTPPDLGAMLSLSVVATAVQKRVDACVRVGWTEQLSVWTVTALGSGNVKSGVYSRMTSPVDQYEIELAESMRSEIEGARLDREITEGRIKRLKDHATKATNIFDRDRFREEAVELAADLARRPPLLAPRFLADDATPEKLAILLSEQGGRISVMSPEANAFEIMAGRYSSGQTNFTVHLKGHSGDDIRVDRVGRASLIIHRPAITMGLLAQPGVLVRLSEQPEFRERGLLARFLFCLPESWVGNREIDPDPVPEEISAAYDAHVRRLLKFPADTDARGFPCPHQLHFSDEAKTAISTFRRWLEPQLAEGAELGYLGDWGGKLHGTLARIAALLHLAEYAEMEHPWEERVHAEMIERTICICHYLIAHAKAAFRLIGTDPAVLGARKILAWLRRKRASQLTTRQIHNAMQGTFQRVDELEGPLEVLVEHGYLRLMPVEKKPGAGRPPASVLEVNPALYQFKSKFDSVDIVDTPLRIQDSAGRPE